MTQTHFTPELFQFLLELRTNNNREWFQDNKGRYELHVKEPILQFIQDFEPSLHSVSTRFIADARANGGSMFRIYRDVRFSKDKSPYKTQAAVQFRHEAGKVGPRARILPAPRARRGLRGRRHLAPRLVVARQDTKRHRVEPR